MIIEHGFPEARRTEIVALLRAYEASLGLRLDFQSFDAEVAGLPGAYAPPGGAFLWARSDDRLTGIVALRPLDRAARIAEMKRLFVVPAARGHDVGRRLAVAAIEAARDLGYARMRLDTLPSMVAARQLYMTLGFAPTAPYYDTPVAGTLFMELVL